MNLPNHLAFLDMYNGGKHTHQEGLAFSYGYKEYSECKEVEFNCFEKALKANTDCFQTLCILSEWYIKCTLVMGSA